MKTLYQTLICLLAMASVASAKAASLANLTGTNLTIQGNSTFDNRINKILHWDGTRESLGIGPDILAGLAIAIGFTAVFCGYKLIRPAVFLCGFAVGAVACFVASEKIFRDKSYIETACWVAFGVGGLLVGLLVVWLYKVGIFIVGAFAGMLLAMQLQTSFGYAIYPSDPQIVLIVLLVLCGLACGAIAVKIERPFLMVATAWAGAVAGVWGIGFFAGNYPNASNLAKHQTADGSLHYDVPDAWWGYLAGTIVLALLGMYVQFRTDDGKPASYQGQARPVTYVAVSTPAPGGNPIRHV